MLATGCAQEMEGCECRCPEPKPIEPGRFRADKPVKQHTKATYPHAKGTDFVLVVAEDKQAYQLSYVKDGKTITETWRPKAKP